MYSCTPIIVHIENNNMEYLIKRSRFVTGHGLHGCSIYLFIIIILDQLIHYGLFLNINVFIYIYIYKYKYMYQLIASTTVTTASCVVSNLMMLCVCSTMFS